LKDAESLTTYPYGCVLLIMQLDCFMFILNSYTLNTTIAFYFVTECSDIAMFVCLMVCHVTMYSYFT